jgi:hypothetical protein
MEKIIYDVSFGLFFWQMVMLILAIAILYYMVKLYKKVTKYLDKNS